MRSLPTFNLHLPDFNKNILNNKMLHSIVDLVGILNARENSIFDLCASTPIQVPQLQYTR